MSRSWRLEESDLVVSGRSRAGDKVLEVVLEVERKVEYMEGNLRERGDEDDVDGVLPALLSGDGLGVSRSVDGGVWQGLGRPGGEHQGERGGQEGGVAGRGEGHREAPGHLGLPPGSVLVVWVVNQMLSSDALSFVNKRSFFQFS